jgi:hypothetical protein
MDELAMEIAGNGNLRKSEKIYTNERHYFRFAPHSGHNFFYSTQKQKCRCSRHLLPTFLFCEELVLSLFLFVYLLS